MSLVKQPVYIVKHKMGFSISTNIVKIGTAILEYSERLNAPKLKRERGQITIDVGDAYYLRIPKESRWIFHISHLEILKEFINIKMRNGMDPYEFIEFEVGNTEPYKCEFKNYGFDMIVEDPTSRFFYQNEVVDTACTEGRDHTIFAIQTGRGKTKSSQKVMVRKGVRTAIIVRPTYIDKWAMDTCDDKTGLREKRDHVWVVEGVQGVLDVISAGRTGELDRRDIKVILIPTVTLGLFLKDFAENPEYYDDIDLFEFYNYLGVGLLLQDEIHEHFRVVYLSAIALNPPKMLEMSATLDPSANKSFIRERYKERFPMSARLSIPYIPVVDILGINYSIDDPMFLRKVNAMKMYSHTEFENLICKHGLKEQYFDMVWDMLERGYLSGYQKGQRALVFFSLVKMCQDFKDYMQRKLKNSDYSVHKLGVAKYNAGDSLKKFLKADIGVSTPGKAGTAIDIPGLIFAVVSVAIDDKQFNEQIAGRPREQFQWDLTPKVCFLQVDTIQKHQRYLNSRYNALKDIVKSFNTVKSPYNLKGNKNAEQGRRRGTGRFSPKNTIGVPRNYNRPRFNVRRRKRR